MRDIQYYPDVEQGTDEWHRLRTGILTASTIGLLLTPKLKAAANDKSRAHLYELAAQRVTNYVEPTYSTFAMERGHDDEIMARDLYERTRAPGMVRQVGFITNGAHGCVLGYSPDGLVGDDGLIEIKSRMQKHQARTIIESRMPDDYLIQVQAGLLISGRKWLDFVSYCGGMPMMVTRILPDEKVQAAIVEVAQSAEKQLADLVEAYHKNVESNGWPMTERIEMEIVA